MSRLRARLAAPRPRGEQGQVLSSLVAVAAVVAIVAGLLVLFGTRGDDSKADEPAGVSPKPSAKPSSGPSTVGASVPKPSTKPTTEETSAPPPPPESTKPPSTAPTETTQPTQTTQPPKPTQPVTIPAEERPAIEVYNNTSRKGLADTVASRARQAGWTVSGSPDNWHGKIAESTVYYPPGMLDAANQLAHDLGIGRTKGALDNMKKDRLTVILTSDYSG
ncbi:LytR C-terminal domain-containing protein [Kribbella sindirgiensis]|uniref:LytR family transcriptional regulator n=1 Tax=Kribbella sindirgiensis TaxID=1124744 RepID=A0A4R0I2L1_9ACTN|nr:LytR C-terminal domain-containing protein [Kribbella sindirgiensis]TCC20652.1 LytR family transcriptional regulator [Kribbella sindirgiensis]